MKRVLGLCLAVALFTLGIAARAEAVVAIFVRICQGAVCVDVGPSPGPGPFHAFNVVVGDYSVSTSFATQEQPGGSGSHTTPIQVRRLSANSAAPLEIWMSGSGYILPVAPELGFFATVAATASAGADQANVTFQAWYSPTSRNFVPGPPTAPPADGITAGPIGCVVGGDTVGLPVPAIVEQRAQRPRLPLLACAAFPAATMNVAGNSPFSLVTRTTFDIPTASSIATFGSTAQASVNPVVP